MSITLIVLIRIVQNFFKASIIFYNISNRLSTCTRHYQIKNKKKPKNIKTILEKTQVMILQRTYTLMCKDRT